MTHSLKRMAKVTEVVLVLGIDPAMQGQPPGDRMATPSGRSRPVRMSPAENMPMPSPERMASRPLGPGWPPPTEVAPARFEATVYEVEVPETRIAELEAPALEAKAGTPQDLAKALAEFGKARVLYKIDQPVNLCGENITLGTREPMITGSRRTETGTTINTITYQEVGLIVNLATSPSPPDAPRGVLPVQVNFELSVLADSGVEIAPTVKATRIRNLHLNHSETPRFGKPLVLLNVSAPPGSDKVLPVAYVVRYVFREVKP
ncbi:MAG: hypothetical protein NTW03_13365 [Verrucomicrobia bacterium]|nr:hypothetical protein [Verrucomicrobiota bacterium]